MRLFPFLYKTLLSLNKSNFMKVRLIQQCCHRFVFIHHLCYSLCLVYFKYLLILLNIDNALVRGAYNISFMIFKCQILIHPARVQLYITAPFKSILSVPRLEMSIKKDSNLIRKAQWQCHDIHIYLSNHVSPPHFDVLIKPWCALAEYLPMETIL